MRSSPPPKLHCRAVGADDCARVRHRAGKQRPVGVEADADRSFDRPEIPDAAAGPQGNAVIGPPDDGTEVGNRPGAVANQDAGFISGDQTTLTVGDAPLTEANADTEKQVSIAFCFDDAEIDHGAATADGNAVSVDGAEIGDCAGAATNDDASTD